MLYFFSQRVSLTICLYFGTCNMGGKPVTKRDELAWGTGQRGTPRCFRSPEAASYELQCHLYYNISLLIVKFRYKLNSVMN